MIVKTVLEGMRFHASGFRRGFKVQGRGRDNEAHDASLSALIQCHKLKRPIILKSPLMACGGCKPPESVRLILL